MGRSLRVALLGWSMGFLVAGLWGLTQTGNPHLASALLAPAALGMAVLLVLVLVGAAHDHFGHRWVDLDEVDSEEHIPPARPSRAATVAAPRPVAAATPAGDDGSARIAALEERLAREQAELDQLLHALAEEDAEALEAGRQPSPVADAPVEPDAAALEPVLRQQVLDALVELVANPFRDVSDT